MVGQDSGGIKKLRQMHGNHIIQIGVSCSKSGDGAAAVTAVGTEAAIVQQFHNQPVGADGLSAQEFCGKFQHSTVKCVS